MQLTWDLDYDHAEATSGTWLVSKSGVWAWSSGSRLWIIIPLSDDGDHGNVYSNVMHGLFLRHKSGLDSLSIDPGYCEVACLSQ